MDAVLVSFTVYSGETLNWVTVRLRAVVHTICQANTVEPPNKGQIGAWTLVHYSEVVLYVCFFIKKAFNSVLYR